MPNDEQWDKYFEPKYVLMQLGLNHSIKDAADFGAGYGTFTIPAAREISGNIYALEIEPEMIKTLQQKAKDFKLNNIKTIQRDFISEGSGLNSSSVDFVLLFNLWESSCHNSSALFPPFHLALIFYRLL
jgi:tRNA/tmRNA/rRNA uracil-C5-methylase (TrmA/RlmC/RlmD family)